MTLKNKHRFNSFQYDRYAINTGTDLTEWNGLLNPNTPPVSVTSRQEGDIIFDSYTGTQAKLFRDDTADRTPRWTGYGGSIIRLYTSGDAIPVGRLVTMDAPSHVKLAVANEPVKGIAMSATTGAGQLLYVLTNGVYLLEPANSEAPSAAGTLVESAANGRYQSLIAGDYYCGWVEIPSVTINTIVYSVVHFRIPILSFAP